MPDETTANAPASTGAATSSTASSSSSTTVYPLTSADPTVPVTNLPTVSVTVPNTSGTVTFQLIVTDNLGQASAPSTATVTIQGAPTANLSVSAQGVNPSKSITVKPGETITLSSTGSAAAAPGTLSSYQFTGENLSAPAGT